MVTVQEEAEQNEQLLALSEQMLSLTSKSVASPAYAQQDHAQNEELLRCRDAHWL